MKNLPPSASLGLCSLLPLLASANAEAGIISNTSLGLGSITLGPGPSLQTWNIDNTGDAEFRFNADTSNLIWLNAVGANDKIHVLSVDFGVYKVLDEVKDAYVKTTGIAYPNRAFAHINATVLKNGKIASGMLTANFKNDGGKGYIGFSFLHNSVTCYGWASVTATEDAGHMGTFTVNSWAFEDAGANIIVGDTGAVPEPSEAALGLGALALGAAGLRRWRKTKAAKAA
jgi:hypothetical protein